MQIRQCTPVSCRWCTQDRSLGPNCHWASQAESSISSASAATFALKSNGKFGRWPDFIDAIFAILVPTKKIVGTNVAFRRYFVQTVLTELLPC